ncbi:MAG: hypothetical protein ACJA2W_003518 [Planctomycetota bacterium]|jgi:hypothetical protein
MRTNYLKGGLDLESGRSTGARVFRTAGGVLVLAAVISALTLTACQTTPRTRGRDTQVLTQGRLAALNPSDIAVAPVILASLEMNAPVGHIRRAAQYSLATRLYSPLSSELVDKSLGADAAAGPMVFTPTTVNASYVPGDLAEDAVLEIYVERWDASNWDIRRSVDVAIEVRMIDPRDPTGPELWAARIDRKFDFTATIETRTAGPKATQDACNKIFRELMAKLPIRDTAPKVELPAGR